MIDKPVTMNDVFGFNLPQGLCGSEPSVPSLAALKNKMAQLTPAVEWSDFSRDIHRCFLSLLDINFTDVLIQAWIKNRSFKALLDSYKTSPGEIILVALDEHTILSVHHPYIEILINEKVVAKIDFKVSIALNLKCVNLRVLGSRIVEIQPGYCRAGCTIECESAVIFQKEMVTVNLPALVYIPGSSYMETSS